MRIHQIGLLVAFALLISSCAKKGCTDPDALNYDKAAERDDESCRYGDRYKSEKQELIRNHAHIAYELYSDAHLRATQLKTHISDFIASPTDDGFSSLKLAWRQAYFAYLRAEALRFSDGPIDDERNLQKQLGIWPILFKSIDHQNGTTLGIVQDSAQFPSINSQTLGEFNDQLNGKQSVIGFHAVEYLLWGEDGDPDLLAAGSRLYTEYSTDSNSLINARRAKYLKVCGDLIATGLGQLVNDWDSLGNNGYYTSFTSLEENRALKNILTGLGTLSKSELAERALMKPIQKQSQEFEISNFSDNTVTDLIAMVQSLDIVYRGTYTTDNGLKISGKSIQDIIEIENLELSERVDTKLKECLELVEAIPTPFDYYALLESEFGEGPITDAAVALKDLEALFREVAREFDIGIETDLP